MFTHFRYRNRICRSVVLVGHESGRIVDPQSDKLPPVKNSDCIRDWYNYAIKFLRLHGLKSGTVLGRRSKITVKARLIVDGKRGPSELYHRCLNFSVKSYLLNYVRAVYTYCWYSESVCSADDGGFDVSLLVRDRGGHRRVGVGRTRGRGVRVVGSGNRFRNSANILSGSEINLSL
jgi:hypothetical protein